MLTSVSNSAGPVPAIFKPLPTQREFLRVPAGVHYDICYYQGGVGSGKSFAAALKGFIRAMARPTVNGMVLGPTIKDLQATVWQSYREVLGLAGLVESADYKFHGDDYLQFYDGAGNEVNRIYWRATAQPERWRSMQVGWCNVEEASVCLTKKSFTELLTRVRQGPPPYLIWMQSNPAEYEGVLSELFGPEQLGMFDDDGVITSVRMLTAPTAENVHLDKSYQVVLRQSLDDLTFRRMVEGEFVIDSSGRVCYNFNEANVDANLAYRKDLPLYLTCDFNVDPMSWAVAQRINGEYHFLDELCLENTLTDPAAEVFHERWKFHRLRPLIICGDASGGNRSTQSSGGDQYAAIKKAKGQIAGNYRILRNKLSSLGWDKVSFDLRDKNPLISERVQAWNAKVCNAAGQRAIKVHPRCKWLIWNMYNFKFRVGGGRTLFKLPTAEQIEKNPELKFTGHIVDAAQYLVEKFDPVKNTAIIKKQKYVERTR